MLELLLEEGCPANAVVRCTRSFVIVTSSILSGMLSFISQDENGSCAIHHAADLGFEEALYLLSGHTDLEIKDRSGRTALHICAAHGYTKCVEALVVCGAIVDTVIHNEGVNVLHVAAQKGFADVIQSLLEYGADVNIETSTTRRTALEIALVSAKDDQAESYRDAVKVLLDADSSVAPPEGENTTILHHIAQGSPTELKSKGIVMFYKEVIGRLIREFACDPCAKNEDGRNPAELASQLGKKQMAELLEQAQMETKARAETLLKAQRELQLAAVEESDVVKREEAKRKKRKEKKQRQKERKKRERNGENENGSTKEDEEREDEDERVTSTSEDANCGGKEIVGLSISKTNDEDNAGSKETQAPVEIPESSIIDKGAVGSTSACPISPSVTSMLKDTPRVPSGEGDESSAIVCSEAAKVHEENVLTSAEVSLNTDVSKKEKVEKNERESKPTTTSEESKPPEASRSLAEAEKLGSDDDKSVTDVGGDDVLSRDGDGDSGDESKKGKKKRRRKRKGKGKDKEVPGMAPVASSSSSDRKAELEITSARPPKEDNQKDILPCPRSELEDSKHGGSVSVPRADIVPSQPEGAELEDHEGRKLHPRQGGTKAQVPNQSCEENVHEEANGLVSSTVDEGGKGGVVEEEKKWVTDKKEGPLVLPPWLMSEVAEVEQLDCDLLSEFGSSVPVTRNRPEGDSASTLPLPEHLLASLGNGWSLSTSCSPDTFSPDNRQIVVGWMNGAPLPWADLHEQSVALCCALLRALSSSDSRVLVGEVTVEVDKSCNSPCGLSGLSKEGEVHLVKALLNGAHYKEFIVSAR